MPGSTRITADGTVGGSGKVIRVFGYTMRSGAGGNGQAIFYNGTDDTGAQKWVALGIVNGSVKEDFGSQGKYFPAGCYIDIDANVTYIDVDYVQETS